MARLHTSSTSTLEYFKSRSHLNDCAHSNLDENKFAYMEIIQFGSKLLLEVFFHFLGGKKSHTKHKKFYQEKTPEFCASTEKYQ